jgi:hypothetical protein
MVPAVDVLVDDAAERKEALPRFTEASRPLRTDRGSSLSDRI